MELEWLRHTKNAWGQKMLVGVSWDLLWIPVAAAAVVIVIHLVLRRRRSKTPGDSNPHPG